MSEKLEKFSLYLATLLVVLLPLFFLPNLVDWFDLPKETLLATGVLVVLALWLGKVVVADKMPVVRSAFLFPALLWAAVSVISAFLSPNRLTSLLLDPIIFTGSVLLLFTLPQLVKHEKALNLLTSGLLLSASLLSFMVVFQTLASFLPTLSKVTQTFPYLSVAFSPTGSALSQAIFLSIVLPVGLGHYLTHRREDTIGAGLNFLFVVVISLGLLANVFFLYRNQPILLPYETGWKVATNSVGTSLSGAFFGVGPGNFLDAFTSGRGIEFNSSKYWNLRFTTSSNFYFYLLTTLGIAGLAAFLLLAAKVIKVAKTRLASGVAQPQEKGLLIGSLLALLLFVLLPAPPLALMTFFILLALLTGHYYLGQNGAYAMESSDLSEKNSWLRPAALIVSLVLLAGAVFYLGRAVLADYYFAQSLVAARNNKGTETYNLQIKAVDFAPTNDSYHVSYSQTNLALADSLAGQPNLSDEQKQTVVALVQQSIREGRFAVALAPKRAADYENLSAIYRALVNFAQGADQWAIASQQQAITLDPANPRLRLDLGGIYFSQKNYQAAGQAFAAAVTLKPDYANAHYNLAQAMKLLGLKEQAVQQLQLTASLVCPADQKGADCQAVNAEISGLTPSPTTTATPEAKLATPSAQPTNLPKAQTKPPAKIASPSGELAQ